eukprot:1394069-Prymnesium_polylepis.1
MVGSWLRVITLNSLYFASSSASIQVSRKRLSPSGTMFFVAANSLSYAHGTPWGHELSIR